MNNDRFDHCLYLAGLTASGCWEDLDTYTQEGIERFAEFIVKDLCSKLEPVLAKELLDLYEVEE